MAQLLRPALMFALCGAALSVGACASVGKPAPHGAATTLNAVDAAMRSGYDRPAEKLDTFPLADAFANAA